MNRNQFDKMLAFLERLDAAKISYTMDHSRDDAIMVVAFAPGEYWEIEFVADGDVDVERYRSDGHIDDESAFDELFNCSDEEKPESTEPAATHDHNA